MAFSLRRRAWSWCRRNRDRRAGQRGDAFIPLPRLFGKLGLRAGRNVIVAIRQLADHGAADAGLGLGDQPLQLRGTRGQRLALSFDLLAIVLLVFRRIDDSSRAKTV